MDDITITDTPSLMRVLGRMESKLDEALDAKKDHEKRINKLEGSKMFERGVIATISAGVSFLVTHTFKT